MVPGSLRHYLQTVFRWIQIKQLPPRIVQLITRLTSQHPSQHLWVGSPQSPPSLLIVLLVIKDKSQPKLVIVPKEKRIEFLVQSMIQQH